MGVTLEVIVGAIAHNRLRVTDHADEEAAADTLLLNDIFASVINGEIIESYPNDKPYPSCLVCGKAPCGSTVHSVWAYNSLTDHVVLITVYRPDPRRWIDGRVRKPRDASP